MNEHSNSIVPGGSGTALVSEIANRLRYMVVNGRKMQEAEIMALANYATINGLNPFAGECYYIDGVGTAPGIAGWRKKAQEQLEYEAQAAHLPGAHFWTEKRKATQDDCKLNAGDIGIVVTLRDWITNSRWRRDYFDAVRLLRETGDLSPLENAKALVGPEPKWEAVGVVRGDESFGRGEKVWTREERAEKRAEKLAIRKRFPRIHLPEPIGAEVDIVDTEAYEPQPRAKFDSQQALSDLGYENTPANAPVVQQEARTQAQPAQVDENAAAVDVPALDYEKAKTVTNSKGQLYIDIDTPTLVNMANSITKKLNANDGTPEETDERQYKLSAIRCILAKRAEANTSVK